MFGARVTAKPNEPVSSLRQWHARKQAGSVLAWLNILLRDVTGENPLFRLAGEPNFCLATGG